MSGQAWQPCSYGATVRDDLNNRTEVLIVAKRMNGRGEWLYRDMNDNVYAHGPGSPQILVFAQEDDIAPEREASEQPAPTTASPTTPTDLYFGVLVYDERSTSPAGHARVRSTGTTPDGVSLFEDAEGNRYMQARRGGRGRQGVEKL